MTRENIEQAILETVSKVAGEKVKRYNSYSYLKLNEYVKREQLVDALNTQFNLSLTGKDVSFEKVGELVDWLVPVIDPATTDSSIEEQRKRKAMEQAILDTVAQVVGEKVKRDSSLNSYLSLKEYKLLAEALNTRFNLTLTGRDVFFEKVGELVDSLVPKIGNSWSEGTSVTGQDGGDGAGYSYSHTSSGNTELVSSNGESYSHTESLSNEDDNMGYKKKYEWEIVPDKTKHQYVIGIDLGHGETSAAYCALDWDSTNMQLSNVKDIELAEGMKVIPSAISIAENGKARIGELAFDEREMVKSETNVCFKKKPESLDGESEQLMMRFMKEVYTTIIERNPALFTAGNHLVFIATPSGWSEKDKDLYGKMAAEAGLPMGGITSESHAAYIKAQKDPDSGLPQHTDKGAIVFDMGSSTLDFTYLSNSSEKPVNWGDDCGASQVEKIIYGSKREGNDDLLAFEKKYPNLVDALLFKARKAKEEIYKFPENPKSITVNFEDIVPDDDEFEDTKLRFRYKVSELSDDERRKGYVNLNQLLEEKGYIGAIRDAMMVFKNEKIGGKPIYGAFLTGGASRMDFIKTLVMECWGLPNDRIFRDQDPSLTISQGVAVLGRAFIRSGGSHNTEYMLKTIIANAQDVFTPFAEALTAKVTDELQRSVITAFNEFRDCETDVSLNDLQGRMGEWIENDTNNIGEWATACYQQAFEEKTADIRAKLDSVVNEFSNTSVKMGSIGNTSVSLPKLDMNEIAAQMGDIGASFAAEAGSISELISSVAVDGAVGFGIGMLVGGPLAWLLLGGYFVGKMLFGEEETEEQKNQKAMAKDLNKSARQQFYDAFFNEKWDEVAGKIANTVHQAVYGNPALKEKINSQSRRVIENYAKDCINKIQLKIS